MSTGAKIAKPISGFTKSRLLRGKWYLIPSMRRNSRNSVSPKVTETPYAAMCSMP